MAVSLFFVIQSLNYDGEVNCLDNFVLFEDLIQQLYNHNFRLTNGSKLCFSRFRLLSKVYEALNENIWRI